MRILVTGATGFTGRHFINIAEAAGHQCVALGTAAANETRSLHVDITDKSALDRALRGLQFDAVVHLAAMSFVAHGKIDEIYSTNVIGTANLFDVVEKNATQPVHFLMASSGNIYGNTNVLPITENSPFNPANDYAASKCAMEMALKVRSQDSSITIVRPFNYTGSGQAGYFLVPKIVNACLAKQEELELGNLDVARDFSDVRDVVQAYLRLLEKKVTGTFNICSGNAVPLSEIIETCSRITGNNLKVKVNKNFVRNNEVKILYGSDEALRSKIGDYRQFQLVDTLSWMLDAQ